MVKRRRRFKQTTTLYDRLAHEAARLREEAGRMPLGSARERLIRRARHHETAINIDKWLAPELRQPT
jgi:hypothetical protein